MGGRDSTATLWHHSCGGSLPAHQREGVIRHMQQFCVAAEVDTLTLVAYFT